MTSPEYQGLDNRAKLFITALSIIGVTGWLYYMIKLGQPAPTAGPAATQTFAGSVQDGQPPSENEPEVSSNANSSISPADLAQLNAETPYDETVNADGTLSITLGSVVAHCMRQNNPAFPDTYFPNLPTVRTYTEALQYLGIPSYPYEVWEIKGAIVDQDLDAVDFTEQANGARNCHIPVQQ